MNCREVRDVVCAFLLTRLTRVGACFMLSPTRTREMLSRTRPNGFRVSPNNPRPHDETAYAVFFVDSGKDFSNSTRANVTQVLLSIIASFNII